MKDEELLEKVKGGSLAVVVEFRGSEGDRMRWVHEKTGRKMEAPIIKHRVEMGSDAFTITEFLDEGADETKVVSPFAKGTKVVWLVDSFSQVKGNIRAGGTLVSYEPSATKPGTVAPR